MIAIVQTSIENGWRSGLRVAFGIWLSDYLFITACYFGTQQVAQITEWNGFELTVGIAGGFILAAFGAGMLISKVNVQDLEHKAVQIQINHAAAWVKGFLVNTINPFTVLFWITISLTVVGKEVNSGGQAAIFYGCLMGIVMLGDVLKVYFSHRIRPWLTANHIRWIRRVSGVAFVIFGIVMILRVV